jgi:DNA-binding PadR family transcriptional regulator
MHAYSIDPREQWFLMGGGRGRGRRRHGGHGGPPFGPHFGGPHFRGRARRGDVRAALLVLIAEEPRNGYGLMQEIEQRSEGAWRPSPGSVYPALQLLEDEGLVRAAESGGRREYDLTDEGRQYVEEHREELGEPWAAVAEGARPGGGELRSAIGQVAAATMQIASLGTDEQVVEARRVLDDARRRLYRILAGDEEA